MSCHGVLNKNILKSEIAIFLYLHKICFLFKRCTELLLQHVVHYWHELHACVPTHP